MKKQTYSLKAQQRDVFGKKVLTLREQGLVPAVVYGPGGESITVTCALGEFEKIYRDAGESSLVELSLDSGEPVNVLIHEVQQDPVIGRPIHVDFYRVNMAEKLTTHIPLVFIDESKAVKEQGGILVKNIDEIEVRCLPGNLVPEIEVSIAPLTELEASIKIHDIVLPGGIELSSHHDPEDIVALVMPPVSEEELKKMEEEGAVQAPADVEKSEEKGKKEEQEKKSE